MSNERLDLLRRNIVLHRRAAQRVAFLLKAKSVPHKKRKKRMKRSRATAILLLLIVVSLLQAQTPQINFASAGLNDDRIDIIIDYSAVEQRQHKFVVHITPFTGMPPTAGEMYDVTFFDTPPNGSFNPVTQTWDTWIIVSPLAFGNGDFYNISIDFYRKRFDGTWEYLETEYCGTL